jgi:hypothetical protein
VQPRGLQNRTDDEGKGQVGHPKLVTLSWNNSNDGKEDRDIIVRLPLPYALPPVNYGPKGEPALPSIFNCICFWLGFLGILQTSFNS